MYAEIIVDILNSQVDRVFDYEVPNNARIGMRALVPFGKRKLNGYIINLKEKSEIESSKIKTIEKLEEDYPVILPEMLELAFKLKNIYNLRLMDCIRLFLPVGMRKNRVKVSKIKLCSLTEKLSEFVCKKNAVNQINLIEYLKQNLQENIVVLNQKFGNSTTNTLLKNGIISIELVDNNRFNLNANMQNNDVVLTKEQQSVLNKIENSKNQNKFLLFGVTGSGKTEVYMRAIQNVINSGKTAIMLVPEISLTPQVMNNFTSRFGSICAILHSGLSDIERFDEWHRILKGEAKIVVGARSGIFAPVSNVGLIVIDEEHDSSYLSESNPRYDTLIVATLRAEYNNCKLILGSATPSIDSFYKAEKGEYELLEMPIRINHKPLPDIQIVDMLSEMRNGNSSFFSNKLLTELSSTIKNKEQAILFLNRRGYNSFVMCKDCGYVAKCEDCDVSLVYHKEDSSLKCHYCSKRYKMLDECPNCHSKYIKYGAVGTQKVVEELNKIFPDVPVFRMDNDTTRGKHSHQQILDSFKNVKPSILVGTQMVAKGHDFASVSLVGIIDADMSLHVADFRATERTFQLVTQVSGRAGRSEIAGKVVLQTYFPRAVVYRLAQIYDYKKFYEKEINIRETTAFPPFTTIFRILVTAEQDQKALDCAKNLYYELEKIKNANESSFIYLNVMKSPIKRIQNKFRYQILMRIKTEDTEKIKPKIFEIHNKIKDKNIISFIEINPNNLS